MPSPTRVLVVGNHFAKTQVCVQLARRLAARGFDVRTTFRHRNWVLRLVDMAKIALVESHLVSVAQVDIFSGRAFLWAEAAALSLRIAGKPFVLTLHGGALPQFAQRHPQRVARLLRKAAAVTAPSAYLAEAMRPFRSDIRVIPNALDLSVYPYRHRGALAPRLVWLRAFHRIYAPEVAIEVLALLAKEHFQAHLTMVGPDKDGSLERCKALATELGVSDRVSFVPGVPKSQVPKVLATGDIFLNTTTVDNTPVSVIEAMACGLCVVSTDAGGVPHLVRDGDDGLLVPVGDSAATMAAVRRALRDPALASRLSANARAKAGSFDWSAVLPAWEDLLRSLVANKPGPRS